MPPSTHSPTPSPAPSSLNRNGYILLTAYVLITSTLLIRISRQPYNSRLKAGQYEKVLKGTGLAALLIGFGISGRLNRRRSEVER
ncbi:hypothetical protein H2201_006665 [Coniosporium apollinis]|uniref:Uncharacterized protein n=2 Tax=Coniosporium TaxID=2810619 RepID=A0ABQ9NPN3_9PEZI|nr:hypothetical protein H2199_003871 [Cladosporium sp. JES 115]KAJ9661114.1 hypothetical protein H2201_006665 [Coniosporium apollinis]